LAKVHDEDPHTLDILPNILSLIKLRKLRMVVYITCRGGMTNAYKIQENGTIYDAIMQVEG
jgi:hypothetical protein